MNLDEIANVKTGEKAKKDAEYKARYKSYLDESSLESARI